jgi:AraC family transcriptional regulator
MAKRSDPEQHYRDRVARVVAAIVSDPLAPHGLDELAALAHFSPFHFHRIYRGVTGETVAATVRRLRLARAAQLLAAGDESVTQVAMAVGYDSPQTFSRAFREFAGTAPRAFQQQRGFAGLGLVTEPPVARERGPRALAVQLVERAPQRVQALQHRGPASTIPHTYWRLMQIAGTWPARGCLGVARGDGEDGSASPDEGFVYHAAVVLDGAPPEETELVPMELAGGRYAQHTLTGPYTQINAAISALYAAWLPQSGFEPDDRPVLEVYHAPFDAPPHLLRTDLLIPIRDLSPR